MDRIILNGKMTEADTKVVIKQVVLAMLHLHSKGIGIAHRDLTPDTIFFESRNIKDLTIKISGLKYAAESKQATLEIARAINSQSLSFQSPNLQSETIKEDEKVDYWSIGCITFFCLVGCAPFTGFSPQRKP